MKKQVQLGQTGMKVYPVGLGCMGFSHASGLPTDHDTAVRTIREAYEMGYDFFDTAECYTGIYPDGTVSYNEELVGEALKTVRNKVIIATKCGVTHGGDHLILDSSPSRIRFSVEGSLKKLGTDHIDLYYQHRIDPKVEPEAVAETMGELIREGKILAWGISETTEEYLRRAHAVTPVTAIENRYSMMARWHESIFPVCEELGITYVAFSPMANGFLTGKYDAHTKFEGKEDFRTRMPQYTEEGVAKAAKLTEMVEALASDKGATPAQVSLAWMMGKRPYVVPIPGTKRRERMEENAGAADVELSAEEIAGIDAALDGMELDVFGKRKES